LWVTRASPPGRAALIAGFQPILTATLAVEWAPKVRVNAVIAGLIATEQAVMGMAGPALVQRYNMYVSVPLQGNAAPGVSTGRPLEIVSVSPLRKKNAPSVVMNDDTPTTVAERRAALRGGESYTWRP